ncbi:hypothetical protein X797_004808 [Metarhizium robertsii]|uniref:Uncharacterized protein n=1 Tax=Metarhizium robertsii TaxID=568076 RepID=A0A0A1UWP9_9HYPO|nr:hypothetical protein X797_004808 [Metarhizium robertsii]
MQKQQHQSVRESRQAKCHAIVEDEMAATEVAVDNVVHVRLARGASEICMYIYAETTNTSTRAQGTERARQDGQDRWAYRVAYFDSRPSCTIHLPDSSLDMFVSLRSSIVRALDLASKRVWKSGTWQNQQNCATADSPFPAK